MGPRADQRIFLRGCPSANQLKIDDLCALIFDLSLYNKLLSAAAPPTLCNTTLRDSTDNENSTTDCNMEEVSEPWASVYVNLVCAGRHSVIDPFHWDRRARVVRALYTSGTPEHVEYPAPVRHPGTSIDPESVPGGPSSRKSRPALMSH